MATVSIPVHPDKFALVDEDDAAFLLRWKWKIHNAGYAVRSGWKDGKWCNVYMHRVIADPPEGHEVDHINRDKLDNRRENLRPVLRYQNMHNKENRPNVTSGRRGVSWSATRNAWWARIQVNKVFHDLGWYDTIEEAGRVYDEARERLLGPEMREVA